MINTKHIKMIFCICIMMLMQTQVAAQETVLTPDAICARGPAVENAECIKGLTQMQGIFGDKLWAEFAACLSTKEIKNDNPEIALCFTAAHKEAFNEFLKKEMEKGAEEAKTAPVPLEIISIPPGATILVDGKPILTDSGEVAVTPHKFMQPQHQEITITLQLEGYKTTEDKMILEGPNKVTTHLHKE